MSAGAATTYYHEQDPIMNPTGDKDSNGIMVGTGAEKLGIDGKLNYEEFVNILNGLSPDGEVRLVGNADGEHAHDKNACTDVVLTVPKSFSLAMLENKEFRDAIMKDLKGIAKDIEKDVYGRQNVDGKTEQVKGAMIMGYFEHSISRPTEGNPSDIGFHAHCVVANCVERPDGTYSTLENHQVMKNQITRQQDVYNVISKTAKEFGFDVDLRKGKGTVIPELKGIDKEVRDVFSKRRDEISNGEARTQLEKDLPNATKSQIDGIMQEKGKLSKDPDLTEQKILDSSRSQVQAIGKDLQSMVANAQTLGKENAQPRLTANDYVKYALADNIEKESVLKREQIINDAIKIGCGDVIRKDVEQAFDNAVKSGEIVQLEKNAYSTKDMIAMEKYIAVIAVTQATKYEPLMSKEASGIAIDKFESEKGWKTSQGQRDAISHVLSGNSGRMANLQGDSGAGKSTAFLCINNALKNSDTEVHGLGFQGKAAAELERSSGIVSQTLHSFLAEKTNPDTNSRKLWVVDESSMLNSKQTEQLVQKAIIENAQIVFVQDNKQISSIGAGSCDKLREYGLLKTSYMTEVKRQKFYDQDGKQLQPGKDDMSKAVNTYAVEIAQDLKRGDFTEAFNKMDKADVIKESPGKDARLSAVSDMFIASHKDTVILCMTNADRKSVIEHVRPILKVSGLIGQKDYIYKTNDPVSVSGVDRRMGYSYTEGNYVTLNKDIGELKAGSIIKISGVDTSKNALTFDFADKDNVLKTYSSYAAILGEMKANGATGTIDLKENGANISQFQKVDTPFSLDEKVMFLKNDNTAYGKENGIKNGVTGYIRSMDEKSGIAKIELDSGKVIDQKMEGAYLSQAEAITINKSQGISERHVVVMATAEDAGGLCNMKTGYVALTRHEQDVTIVTDNKEQLLEAISRESNKTSTLDYMPKEEMEKLQAEYQKTVEAEKAPEKTEVNSIDQNASNQQVQQQSFMADAGIQEMAQRVEESKETTQELTPAEKIRDEMAQMVAADNAKDLAPENPITATKEREKDAEQQAMQIVEAGRDEQTTEETIGKNHEREDHEHQEHDHHYEKENEEEKEMTMDFGM